MKEWKFEMRNKIKLFQWLINLFTLVTWRNDWPIKICSSPFQNKFVTWSKLLPFWFCITADRKSKILDDDSDRGSEASSGSRSKKSNSRASGKTKANKKKTDEAADEDSDTSQASGKTFKKKARNTLKMKKEKIIISKRKKERKKSTGESLMTNKTCFVFTSGGALCKPWSKHVYSEHDRSYLAR